MFNYNDDIKQDIGVAAYFLSKKEISYNDLCWMLAERQLYLNYNFQKADQNSIKEQATTVYKSIPPYDVLCWLISEIDFLLKTNVFKSKEKPHFVLD